MCKSLSDKTVFIFALLIIFLYISPYIILGEEAYVAIHDFLDSNVAHIKVAIEQGLIWSRGGEMPLMNGISSSFFISPYPIDVKSLLYILLPTYWAIVVNVFFVKCVAYLGMFLLTNRYVFNGNICHSFIIAILFCLIPFYADYGLSSAGVPLFLYAVINIEKKQRILLSFILIIVFAINSSPVLVGYCVCLLWMIWILIKVIKYRYIPKYHITGLLVVIFVYLYTMIPLLIENMINEPYISHRSEFVSSSTVWNDVVDWVQIMLESHYHAGSFLAFPLLIISISVFIVVWRRDQTIKQYILLFVIIMLLILTGKLINHFPYKPAISFQFDRFYFLFPSLCFLMLAKALSISKEKVFALTLTLSFSLVGFAYYNTGFRKNVRIIAGIDNHKYPSFRQYYDTRLFEKIKSDISVVEKPYNCKVVSLGLYPAVAEFNGFYTLDSYVPSYSLEYKHKFREVIKKELDKNEYLRRYYDEWGSRCYLFSSEIGTDLLIPKESGMHVKKLEIDTNVLKGLKCEYILSAVEIDNYKELNLELVNEYTTDQSFYKIRVYKLI